jgi:hypothetical protein
LIDVDTIADMWLDSGGGGGGGGDNFYFYL